MKFLAVFKVKKFKCASLLHFTTSTNLIIPYKACPPKDFPRSPPIPDWDAWSLFYPRFLGGLFISYCIKQTQTQFIISYNILYIYL